MEIIRLWMLLEPVLSMKLRLALGKAIPNGIKPGSFSQLLKELNNNQFNQYSQCSQFSQFSQFNQFSLYNQYNPIYINKVLFLASIPQALEPSLILGDKEANQDNKDKDGVREVNWDGDNKEVNKLVSKDGVKEVILETKRNKEDGDNREANKAGVSKEVNKDGDNKEVSKEVNKDGEATQIKEKNKAISSETSIMHLFLQLNPQRLWQSAMTAF